MKTKKPAPVPYAVEVVGDSGPHDNPVEICEIVTVDGYERIAEYVRRENADFIVRACNRDAVFEQMRAALRWIISSVDSPGLGGYPSKEAITAARAALADADAGEEAA